MYVVYNSKCETSIVTYNTDDNDNAFETDYLSFERS